MGKSISQRLPADFTIGLSDWLGRCRLRVNGTIETSDELDAVIASLVVMRGLYPVEGISDQAERELLVERRCLLEKQLSHLNLPAQRGYRRTVESELAEINRLLAA